MEVNTLSLSFGKSSRIYKPTKQKSGQKRKNSPQRPYTIIVAPKMQQINAPKDSFTPSLKKVKDESVQEEFQIPAEEGTSEKTTILDELEEALDKEDKTETSGPAKTKSKRKKVVSIIVSLITLVAGIFGGKLGDDYFERTPNTAVVDFDSDKDKLSDIAQSYNIDEDDLKDINNIYDNDDLKEINQLTIPKEYNYLEDEIENVENKLYSIKDKDNNIYSLGRELDALTAKAEEQKALATVYSDDKFVYICVKDFSENPELIQKYKGDVIDADVFSKLFDIKNNAVFEYNTPVYSGRVLDNSEKGEHIESFSQPVIASGATIKVPVSDIKTDNIDLSGYFSED